MSAPPRWTLAGVCIAGSLGGIIGLLIGLHVYAPTAPVAMIELGLPAAVLGGIVGMAADLTVMVGRRTRRRSG